MSSRKKQRKIRLMEVCGTHTVAIHRAGIKKLLSDDIELISGPGCPVCVTSQRDIEMSRKIASLKNVIMTTFADMMRVPGSEGSLLDLKAQGADIRMVYSVLDALEIARKNKDKSVVFMGIGFETTSPTVASAVIKAKKEKINNFFVLSAFKLLFPALELLAGSKELKVDGFICPGHVSVITGSAPYERTAFKFKKPCVITGFEPNDILRGISCLLKQIKKGEHKVQIEYDRAVKKDGNKTARRVLENVFKICDSEWRGFGLIKNSGLCFKEDFRHFAAEEKFNIKVGRINDISGCLCSKVIKGAKEPFDCVLFGKKCTPSFPVGPCMVSAEGACQAYYRYSRD